jgi:beta-galactosidase
MGFLVMDESFDEWLIPKTGMKFGYTRFFNEWSEHDLVGMLHRDRNHPCIVLWSIGNEIKEQAAPQGGAMAQRLADICRREDPTRSVTSGCNKIGQASANGFTKALDVIGINYFPGNYQSQKGRPLVASETASALTTRGEYGLELKPDGIVAINTRPDHQCTAYDLDHPFWGSTAEESLLALKNAPWVAGEFVWTGFDYLGEPTPFGWPSRSSYFGIIDLAGFPKDNYWLYQSQWTDKPVIHLLPHWNWKGFDGKEIPVWCYTNADTVELFLNGKSLGRKDIRSTKSLHLEWSVGYEPGVLKAVGHKGEQTFVDEVHTAGPPAKLILHPDRKQIASDGDDLSFVEARIEDSDGNLCPNADDEIAFSIDGPAQIVGVDNGDPTNHEPFKATKHKAFHGLCLAVIQGQHAPGTVHLTATAGGMKSEPAEIAVKADHER